MSQPRQLNSVVCDKAVARYLARHGCCRLIRPSTTARLWITSRTVVGDDDERGRSHLSFARFPGLHSERLIHRRPRQQIVPSYVARHVLRISTMSNRWESCRIVIPSDQDGSTTRLGNSELLRTQDPATHAVTDRLQDLPVRVPHRQHCGHLLENNRFVRFPASLRFQNPSQWLENEPCPLVLELCNFCSHVLAGTHALHEAEDLVKGSSSTTRSRNRERLARRATCKNRGIRKTRRIVVAHITELSTQLCFPPCCVSVRIPLDSRHRNPKPVGGYVEPSGSREKVHDLGSRGVVRSRQSRGHGRGFYRLRPSHFASRTGCALARAACSDRSYVAALPLTPPTTDFAAPEP